MGDGLHPWTLSPVTGRLDWGRGWAVEILADDNHPAPNDFDAEGCRHRAMEARAAWLETVDSYLFTAEAAVLSVEKLLGEKHVGVLPPALAFGADFVLEVPGTKRVDELVSG